MMGAEIVGIEFLGFGNLLLIYENCASQPEGLIAERTENRNAEDCRFHHHPCLAEGYDPKPSARTGEGLLHNSSNKKRF